MSLTNPLPRQTRVSPLYACDGVNATFGVPFWFLDALDLVIRVVAPVTGVVTYFKDGLGYSASGAGNPGGGNITMTIAPVAGATLTIYGKRIASRITSVYNGGAVSGTALDLDLDAITATEQELRRDIDALDDNVASFSYPELAPNRDALKALDFTIKKTAIIHAEGGRNGLFVFDSSDLSAKVAADTQEGIYVAPTFDPSGATGAWVRSDYLNTGVAQFEWWGPTLDGVTDSLPLAQAAYNALPPDGTLVVSGEGTLFLSGNVVLSGEKRLNYVFREPLSFASANVSTRFRGGEAAQSLTDRWRNTVARTMTGGSSGGALLYDIVNNASDAAAGYVTDSVRINAVQRDPSQGSLTNGVAPTITKYMTGLASYVQIGAGNYFGRAHAMLSWVLSPPNGGGTIAAHEFNTINRSDMRRTVVNVARASNVVTITTITPHHLGVGQYVRVAVDTETSLNGWFLVTSVIDETNFTYTLVGSNIASTPDTGEIEQRAINVNGGANKTALRVVMYDDYPISSVINIDTASGSSGAFRGIYMSANTLNSTYSGEDSFKRYIQIGPGILELDKSGKLMLGKTGSNVFLNGFEVDPSGVVYNTAAAGASEFSIVRSGVLGASEVTLGKVNGRGINSAGSGTLFCGIEFRSANGTSGNVAGKMVFRNQVANTYTTVGSIGAGLVIGDPTGGDPGIGRINIATEYRVAGNKVLGARAVGWGAPSGTLDRTALAAYAGQTASAAYVQAEAQATDDAVKKVSQAMAALLTDLRTHGVIGN